MTNRNRSRFLALAAVFAAIMLARHPLAAQTDEFESHVKTGEKMPAVSVIDTDGRKYTLNHPVGKVLVVSFWATWCGPCKLEIPRLESEVWKRYRADPNFSMVAIAREQTPSTILPFRDQAHFTFPIASDPQRKTYALFADAGIPRIYVVDGQGKVLVQTVGFKDSDFEQVKAAVATALAKP